MTDEGTVYTGLEILIQGPAGEAIDAWRSRYDQTYPELEPHISLAYPPFVPFEQWKQVKPALVACLEAFEQFPILFNTPGFFQANSPIEPHVLWLKPEDGGMLERIRRTLEKEFPNFVPPMPRSYIPHVSIGFIQGDEALQEALARVRAEMKPFEFEVTEVVYEVDDKAHHHKFLDVMPLCVPSSLRLPHMRGINALAGEDQTNFE